MSRVSKDLAVGIRTILRSPGYSAITVLTLALAIGANTLLFSIANPLVLRPLPLHEPDRLGWLVLSSPERGVPRSPASVPDLLEWRRMTSFTALAAYDLRSGTLIGHGDANPRSGGGSDDEPVRRVGSSAGARPIVPAW